MSGYTSVSEFRRILLEIDGCSNEVEVTFLDGTPGKNPCTIQTMCDECVEKFAGMLEWAEDSANESVNSGPSA